MAEKRKFIKEEELVDNKKPRIVRPVISLEDLKKKEDGVYILPDGDRIISTITVGHLENRLIPSDEFWNELLKTFPKEKPTFKLYGKECQSHRIIFEMSKLKKPYSYRSSSIGIENGFKSVESFPKEIESIYEFCRSFDKRVSPSCLFNVYEGEDYISAHSDDEKKIIPLTPVFTFVFYVGENRDPRPFILNGKYENKTRIKFDLEHGSYLIMGGGCQVTHTHEVPKAPKNKNKRISLTFRCFEK